MINLEIKVRAPNLEQIKEKALQIGSVPMALLRQTDTYFLVGKRRLKLREEEQDYLILYSRPDVEESKLSSYHMIRIPKHYALVTKKILSRIFGLKAVVKKERELLLYRHTRIHLDSVEGLGNFVELETVFEEGVSEDTLNNEHEFVFNSIGLRDLEKVKDSYSDLIAKQLV